MMMYDFFTQVNGTWRVAVIGLLLVKERQSRPGKGPVANLVNAQQSNLDKVAIVQKTPSGSPSPTQELSLLKGEVSWDQGQVDGKYAVCSWLCCFLQYRHHS
eukprot:1150025-Pelagomonas_calceolata.AAC.2